MKKILALVLILAMSLTLAACGGAKAASAPAEKAESVAASTAESAPASTAEESVAEEANTVDWAQYSDVLVTTFMGVTPAGELVVFAANEDISFAILAAADPESMESVSFVGEVTEDEATKMLTITDETSQLTLTFSAVMNDDNTVTLDMGEEMGTATIAACEQADAFDALSTIDSGTTAVA